MTPAQKLRQSPPALPVGVFLVAFLLISCVILTTCDCGMPPGDIELVVLYTSDEHGRIEETDETDGVARMLGLWEEDEGLAASDGVLVLSGGDMWSGTVISDDVQGESVVEVMNAMGYDGAALGNHEFDFGLVNLQLRAAEMDFPLLAANVIETATGEIPDFASAYVIRNVAGISVGVIGLASLRTPNIVLEEYVAPFEFIDCELTLRDVVPEVKAAGAQLVVVISHLCPDEMRALAPAAAELGVSVIGGGHCHVRLAETTNGVELVEAGEHLTAYVRIVLRIDPDGEIVAVSTEVKDNTGGTPDQGIETIIAEWL